MFVTEKSFAELKNLDLEVRKMCAKVVNNLINFRGTVLYGVVYDDGTYHNFSSTKDRTDTHVLIAIGADYMGMLDPVDKEVEKTPLDEDDKVNLKDRHIKNLEGELHQLRELQKIWEKPKPTGGHPV